MQLETVK